MSQKRHYAEVRKVEFLTASAAKSSDGGPMVCVTLRGLDPANEWRPFNLLLTPQQADRMLREVGEAVRTPLP